MNGKSGRSANERFVFVNGTVVRPITKNKNEGECMFLLYYYKSSTRSYRR